MIFQLAWTGLSVLFWLFGSQRGLLALGLGSFGFASRFGFLGPIAGLVSYFVVPETLPWYLTFLFVYLRPIAIIVITIFAFAATSHANNILLRTIQNYERQTQIFILVVCSTLYSLSCWLLVSVYTISANSLLTWTTTTLLLLNLLGHALAFSGLGTLFDMATSLFLVSWSMRMAVQDNLGPNSEIVDLIGYILPYMSVLLLVMALIAVPFVYYDEQAYEMNWRSIAWDLPNMRLISLGSSLMYIYELIGIVQANAYHDWGLWRTMQAVLVTILTFTRFVVRIRENRQ